MNVRVLRGLGFLLLLSACSSDREKPDTPLDDGGASDGQVRGDSGSPSDAGRNDGGVNGGDSGAGSTDGSVVLPGCQTTCALGQRCELTGSEYLCKDNACADLSCSGIEECAQAPGGGHYCKSIACTSDVQCSAARHCDGTKCVDDVCEPGAAHCSGSQVIQCASNGGAETPRFSCAKTAYFDSACAEASSTSASCSCEDDWDCPNFTSCIAGTCQGTGVAPTCTLAPEPFEKVLPTLEFRWGGASNASPAATGRAYPAHAQVSSTPMVANLDDDNGDGFINELDFPEIIFTAYSGSDVHVNGILRAVHAGGPKRGQDYFALCGSTRWFEGDPVSGAASCSSSAAVLRANGGVAVGDIDADGVPEIVAATEEGKLQIISNTGVLISTSANAFIAQGDASPNDNAWKYPQLALVNLDNAGFAEVVVGNRVFVLEKNSQGKLQVRDVFVGQAAEGAQHESGTTRHFGPMVCPANLIDANPNDADVSQEIVVGTALYALPTAPAGVTRRADCAGSDTTDFCLGRLRTVWNARTVNSSDLTATDEAFCAVADVLGANTAAAPSPANPLDRVPEVVLVSNGRLLILNGRTGAILRKITVESNQRGGAPNIDDFDGDGFPEIALASSSFYTVVDLQDATSSCPAWPNTLGKTAASPGTNTARDPGGDSAGLCDDDADCNGGAVCANQHCVCLHNGWRRATEDDSSKATSSSVFDFNGDGAAEVVYGDECYFRVYDGASGEIHLAIPSVSRTVLENPVVADVDNDGNAEIVFVNNNETLQCGDSTLTYPDQTTVAKDALPNGIQVWGDAKDTWVSARRIWNQHAYHVTNVTEGGQIPRMEPESWRPYGNRVYDTYRSQPRSFGVAPDLALTAIQISSPDVACGQLSNMLEISVLVQNLGDLRTGPGVKVKFYGEVGGTLTALLDENDQPITHTLTTSLEPGSSLLASVSYLANGSALPTRVVARIDEDQAERECRENNNEVSGDVSAGAALADLHLDLVTSSGTCAAKVVKVDVRNDGALPASSVLVRLYAGNPSAGGQVLVEHVITGPIAPGANVEADIALGAVNRDITVWGIVDPQDAIAECNDVNNVDKGDALLCGAVVI